MRVGRPVKALPQPLCDYCGSKALLARAGDDTYPYRENHGPLWICVPCQAWIGIFPRSVRNVPLGRLANEQLRQLKPQVHAALEPLVAAKVRRDSCNVYEARSKAFQWLAGELGIDPKRCQLNHLDPDQCRRALEVIARFLDSRRPGRDSSGSA
jgi:hypothetical protein